MGRALDGLLASIRRNGSDKKAEAQIQNVLRLAERCWASRPKSVAPVFGVVDKLVKRRGDKRLVLHAADLSIKAARQDPLRTNLEVEAEARALVCGRAWVHQRIGRLKEAVVAIENATQLGRDIGCNEIVAFATKCFGRVRRLEAEESSTDPARRSALLRESANLLRGAIDRFERLDKYGPDHPEVGDCFSLLGRTEFEAGNVPAAEAACREALKLLTDDTKKEWADLQILLGDIAANSDKQASIAYYDAVIALADPDDATHSEVKARAHFRRGLALKVLNQPSSAIGDFKQARAIWRGLQDPLASKAEWAELWASGAVEKQLIDAFRLEPFSVRVRAAQIHKEQIESRQGTYVARRSGLSTAYLEQLRRDSRKAVAVEETRWHDGAQ